MELTKKQEECLKTVVDRIKQGERYSVISGYAGSGKTSLVRFIVEALNIDEKYICYACFTGKAVDVLRKKGNKNVSTLHKLLYENIPLPDGSFHRIKKVILPYKLIIADECSMIPQEMVDQLSHYKGLHTIYLGDPFQLPPVDKTTENNLLQNPHYFLDEVVRQAKESEIIRVSMDIRNGSPLVNFEGNEVKILSKNDLNTGMLTWADQIIVGTNKTRNTINQQMRELNGLTGEPQEHDKVICTRNYWDIFSNEGTPLINGSIGELSNIYESYITLPYWISNRYNIKRVDILCGDFITNGEKFTNLKFDKKMFETGTKTLDDKVQYLLNKNPKTQFLVPSEFEYGYAVTCHKAQGSQWNNVLVIEEKFPFAKQEHARWLYTAVTRPVEKLVLVR